MKNKVFIIFIILIATLLGSCNGKAPDLAPKKEAYSTPSSLVQTSGNNEITVIAGHMNDVGMYVLITPGSTYKFNKTSVDFWHWKYTFSFDQAPNEKDQAAIQEYITQDILHDCESGTCTSFVTTVN